MSGQIIFGSKMRPSPQTQTRLIDGNPVSHTDEPSADFLLHTRLHIEFVQRFKDQLHSGQWVVMAMRHGGIDRERIANNIALMGPEVSFLGNSCGAFFLVEIHPIPGKDCYLKMKWFIEQVCEVIPPKMGMGRSEVQDLAHRLLAFEVRDDLFKASWAEAKKPAGWAKPGPKG